MSFPSYQRGSGGLDNYPPNPPVKGGKKPPSLPSPLIMGGVRGVQGDFGNFARVGVIGECLPISLIHYK